MRLALVAAVLAAAACPSNKDADDACTCASDEKFDGEECVAADDFPAPEDCSDDGTAVCGCDGKGYTSECDAYAVGVQVRNDGPCDPGGSGGGGGGW